MGVTRRGRLMHRAILGCRQEPQQTSGKVDWWLNQQHMSVHANVSLGPLVKLVRWNNYDVTEAGR